MKGVIGLSEKAPTLCVDELSLLRTEPERMLVPGGLKGEVLYRLDQQGFKDSVFKKKVVPTDSSSIYYNFNETSLMIPIILLFSVQVKTIITGDIERSVTHKGPILTYLRMIVPIFFAELSILERAPIILINDEAENKFRPDIPNMVQNSLNIKLGELFNNSSICVSEEDIELGKYFLSVKGKQKEVFLVCSCFVKQKPEFGVNSKLLGSAMWLDYKEVTDNTLGDNAFLKMSHLSEVVIKENYIDILPR